MWTQQGGLLVINLVSPQQKKWDIVVIKFKYIYNYASIKRNVVHFNHIFVITMWLLCPIDFMINVVLVLHVHVVTYVTIGRVQPNSNFRCDYNIWLI